MLNNAVTTKKGTALSAKVVAGEATFKFTKIRIGSGIHDKDIDLKNLTDLSNPQQTGLISSVHVVDETNVFVRSILDNKEIINGFYISEVGIFAEDPDEGEILYNIATGVTDKMAYHPSVTEMENYSLTMDMSATVSDADKVELTVSIGAMASAEDMAQLNQTVQDIDTNKLSLNGGDISNTVVGSVDEIAGEFPVPVAGDSSKTFLGKIRKFITDFNNFKTGILTVGMIVNNAITNNSGLPVSAAVAKDLQDQVSKLNSDLTSKANSNHNHDNRYFTETETNTLLNAKANVGHIHNEFNNTIMTKTAPNNLWTDSIVETGVYIFSVTTQNNTIEYFPTVGNVGDSYFFISFGSGKNVTALCFQRNYPTAYIGQKRSTYGWTWGKSLF